MQINWRLVGAAAIAAFTVSFLTGVISGAALLVVLLRALIIAVLMGGFMVLAGFLLKTFVPDLVLGADNPAESMSDSGRNVDIVLDAEEAAREVAEVERPQTDDSDAEEMEPEGESYNPDVSVDASLDMPVQDLGGDGKDEPAGQLVEKQEGNGFGTPRAAVAAKPPHILDDVDILPDLDSLGDAFVQPVKEIDPFAHAGGSGTGSRGSSSMPGGTDAETLAKAVRTVLSRDSKG